MVRRTLFVAFVLGSILAPSASRADDDGGTFAESINASELNPSRYLYEGAGEDAGPCLTCSATDVTGSPRKDNPEGINYTDCQYNLRLDFPLVTSGFSDGLTHIEVWAGTEDCTQDANRSPAGGSAHPCWQVAPEITSIKATFKESLFARDILRYEVTPATSGASQPYDATFASSSAGIDACTVQPTDAAISIGVYFIPVESGHAVGTSYEYAITADTVGPPAPPAPSVTPGDTLLNVSWDSVSSDPDVAGYLVYMDPPGGNASSSNSCGCGTPGSSSGGGDDVDGSGATGGDATAMCVDSSSPVSESGTRGTEPMETGSPESGSSESDAESAGDTGHAVVDGSSADAEGTSEGGEESGAEAAEAGTPEAGEPEAGRPEAGAPDGGGDGGAPSHDGGASDAGSGASGSHVDAGGASCIPVNRGGTSAAACGSGVCSDSILSATVFVGSATSIAVTQGTDAGDEGGTDAGSQTTTVTGSTGISQIPSTYVSGTTAAGTTSIAISGLTNGMCFHVAVASTDGSDNVGPASQVVCATPQPVQDYWNSYKSEGGTSSGCALESASPQHRDWVFAFGMSAVGAAWIRRRRRGPRRLP